MYNVDFDRRLKDSECERCDLRSVRPAVRYENGRLVDDVNDVMHAYSWYHGEWSEYWGNFKWQKLSGAIERCALGDVSGAHNALWDAEMTTKLVYFMSKRG
jgi:DNA polymerase III epsilon subunit-like protein